MGGLVQEHQAREILRLDDEIAGLRAINAELLAALEKIANRFADAKHYGSAEWSTCEEARAAINRAREAK